MNRVTLSVLLATLLFPSGAGAETSRTRGGIGAAKVDAIYPDIEKPYVELHRSPELAFREHRTAATLAARLEALGYAVTTGVGGTGIVAILENGSGPIVMFRTELDALPIEEKTGLQFDFCAHSPVRVTIGGVTLVDPADGDWAVNVSALYLLRTLEESLTLGQDEQLFPCCGHVPALDEHGRFFNIGCSNGINLEIERSGESVAIAGASGEPLLILSALEWHGAVISFADDVEAFYGRTPKVISDPDDRKAMDEFWREWRERRKRA